jgi:hypothetical protein
MVNFQQIKEKFPQTGVFSNVNVTPELASELLGCNVSNRPIKDNVFRQYTKDMKNNRWKFNGDIIRFSKSGRLLDGQHRLLAIVESGEPQIFNLQTGLDEEVFDVIDTGKNRTAGDVLSIEGFTNTNVLAAAIRIILQHDSGKLSIENKNIEYRWKAQDVVLWLKENGSEEIMDCLKFGNLLYMKNHLLQQSTLTAFIYMFCRASNSDKGKEFFDMLMTGNNISPAENSPIFYLREKLILWASSRKVTTQREKYATIIKAWNYWLAGRKVPYVRWRSNEKYPEIA